MISQAVVSGNVRVVEALLAGGADASVKDGMLQRTPLTLAKKKNREEIVKLLEHA